MPLCLALASCSGVQSTLDPAGPSALIAARLWWWMAGYSLVVLVVVVALWLLAFRRGRSVAAVSDPSQANKFGQRWIIGGGVLLPLASVSVLLAFGIPAGHRMLPLPVEGGRPLRIEVTGQQWWWEVHYPESGVRLRNELRLPVGQPIDIHTTSRDVIHSFWVPRLAGKIDALPGRVNVLRVQADEAAQMRGQCAEFCGLEHAHMVLTVHAMPAEQFAAWLENAR